MRKNEYDKVLIGRNTRAAVCALFIISVLCAVMLSGCAGSQTAGVVSATETASAADAAGTELYTDRDGDLSGANYEYAVNDDDTLTLTGYTGKSEAPLIPTEINGKSVVKLDRTFIKNSLIAEIEIPDGIIEIGEFCFYQCRTLKRVGMAETVDTIKNQAFGQCVSLEEIAFPSGQFTIYKNAFNYCRSLESFTLRSNTNFQVGAFSQSGISSLTIADDVDRIPEGAFQGCAMLTSVHIPSNVGIIEDNAFWGCENLSSVTFDEGVFSIRAMSFAGCRSLSEISLPQSLEYIGPGTFEGCDITVHAYQDAPSYRAWGNYYDIVQYYCNNDGSISWIVEAPH